MQNFVATTLKMLKIEGPPAYDIRLAVDEITTNIVKHAYKDKAGLIWITCYRPGNEFYVIVKDEGRPFDPTTTPPPDLTSELEKRNIGGLGIYFVRRVMTRMSYEYKDGKNVVTMVKNWAEISAQANIYNNQLKTSILLDGLSRCIRWVASQATA